MGTRFRRSFKVAPGVRVNLNKKSASARALFVQVYPDTRGHLKAASKPCTHAFPSYVRFLAFSHLWHNITTPKLVKSILHSHL